MCSDQNFYTAGEAGSTRAAEDERGVRDRTREPP